ncbi:MAG: RNA polymerase sporulation sigma factor SigK [Clostridiales bacterium]|nr:RNA polymerase sporulation sigma factor SigK [Clostridiales bacterium]
MLEGIFNLLKNLIIFSSYVDTKNSFPKPLSKEKEAEYIARAQQGDSEARDLLIKHNLRLVAHIAKKYSNYSDPDELISVGSIGLIKAINSYKLGKGSQLATYASKCIENEILMTLRVNKKHSKNVSLQEPVGIDREGNEMTLIDLLSSEFDSVINDVESNVLMERLKELTRAVLSDREYEIIRQRYGLGGIPALTQREVADKFGISRSYVSRIEKKAIEKIRSHIDSEELYFD